MLCGGAAAAKLNMYTLCVCVLEQEAKRLWNRLVQSAVPFFVK